MLSGRMAARRCRTVRCWMAYPLRKRAVVKRTTVGCTCVSRDEYRYLLMINVWGQGKVSCGCVAQGKYVLIPDEMATLTWEDVSRTIFSNL